MQTRALTPALHDAANIMRRLDELALCTDQSDGITRLFLSDAHKRAVLLVQDWMRQAGLQTRLDSSGTLVGTLPCRHPNAGRLLLGSHIDTVRSAGRYDGCLGVAMAIEAAARLRNHAPLPYTMEIRAFGDEEGVRFPHTLTGSHAASGAFDPVRLQARDADGVTLADALRQFGVDPDAMKDCVAADAFAYLEVHIEQGPVLEKQRAPLGIVTAINGAARFEVTVTGQAGHAGTVPMADRHDALVAASAMVLAISSLARAQPEATATVGRLHVVPNAANVIPGRCVFTIDVRAAADATRTTLEGRISDALQAAASDNAVTLVIRNTHSAPSVTCDARLQRLLSQSIEWAGLPILRLPSGAGHDAMAMASLCPVGMLFVRCLRGISHHPDENVAIEDVDVGLEVLVRTLQAIEPAAFTQDRNRNPS